MNINFVVKGFELTQGARDGVEAELTSIEKMLNFKATSYNVTIKKLEYGEYECRINTRVNSRDISVKVSRISVRKSIEAAARALKDTVIANNSKAIASKRGEATCDFEDEDTCKTCKSKTHGKVTKVKDVHLTPVSDEEAIKQLQNSSFDMYMYLDEATLELKGVYYRGDGYGVINFKTT